MKDEKQSLIAFAERAIDEIKHPMSLKFAQALIECLELHNRKQRDYGTDADPFANIRSSEEFGVAAWRGAMIRGNDKVNRIKTYCEKGTLVNEGVEDAFKDLAVYALIALTLWREEMRKRAEREEEVKDDFIDRIEVAMKRQDQQLGHDPSGDMIIGPVRERNDGVEE